MTTQRLNADQTRTRTVTGRIRSLAESRQVRAIVSTEALGRDNCIVESRGVDFVAYKQNPIVLVNHNADRPVARAIWIDRVGSEIHALVQFPPKDVSVDADETLPKGMFRG